MATWEDGPEYAPIERPADFAVPDVAPLEVAPAPHQPAANAPIDRPRFDDPQTTVAPLAALVAAPKEQRDPQTPFQVVSATLTSDSAWGATHSSAPGGSAGLLGSVPAPPAGPPPAAFPSAGYANAGYPTAEPPNAGLGPANGQWTAAPPAAWRDPSGLAAPSSNGAHPPLLPSSFPPPASSMPPGAQAPGSPQWYGPAPQQPAPVTVMRVVEAVTPGLLICLAIGGFIYVLAPVTLTLAYALSSRVAVAQQQVKRAFLAALGLLGLIALFAGLAGDIFFSDWWRILGVWAVFISWVMVVVVVGIVVNGLRSSAAPPPPPYRPWS